MRITAGDYKGRRLESPHGDAIRPTSDKIRQAIFNALQARGALIDTHVLDVFCGTGALGLEALSRGAAHCVFIDQSRDSLKLTQRNIALCCAEDRTETIQQDALKLNQKPDHLKMASLVFCDPPYHKNLIPPALATLVEKNWTERDALFVLECDKKEVIDCPPLDVFSEKIYGTTKIIFAHYKAHL